MCTSAEEMWINCGNGLGFQKRDSCEIFFAGTGCGSRKQVFKRRTCNEKVLSDVNGTREKIPQDRFMTGKEEVDWYWILLLGFHGHWNLLLDGNWTLDGFEVSFRPINFWIKNSLCKPAAQEHKRSFLVIQYLPAGLVEMLSYNCVFSEIETDNLALMSFGSWIPGVWEVVKTKKPLFNQNFIYNP